MSSSSSHLRFKGNPRWIQHQQNLLNGLCRPAGHVRCTDTPKKVALRQVVWLWDEQFNERPLIEVKTTNYSRANWQLRERPVARIPVEWLPIARKNFTTKKHDGPTKTIQQDYYLAQTPYLFLVFFFSAIRRFTGHLLSHPQSGSSLTLYCRRKSRRGRSLYASRTSLEEEVRCCHPKTENALPLL